MKIGPKYKIARRLGAGVFEKTQTPKFALASQKRKVKFFPKQKTGYAAQVIEKQKIKFTYFISEKQLANYVKKAFLKNPSNAGVELFQSLEARLDNVVLRSGFCKTRFSARQAVSHGHFLINGKRNNVPSHSTQIGDIVTIRESSKSKGLFADLDERLMESNIPAWLSVDKQEKTITVKGNPVYSPSESHFDITSVIQFYKR